jgi:hypothetical protein
MSKSKATCLDWWYCAPADLMPLMALKPLFLGVSSLTKGIGKQEFQC